jgi:hypothetical protein
MDPSLPPDSTVTPLPPDEVKEAQTTVEDEYQNKPHGGSKTPYIIFGLAIALIVIFAIVVGVFFLLGNTPATYELTLVNTTGSDLAIILNNYDPITLGPNQTQIVIASPGALFSIYGYNVGSGPSGPHTTLTMWLANQTYTGTPYLIVNNVRQNTAPSNNNSPSDKYQMSIVDGYNLAIQMNNGAVELGPIWATKGSCPAPLPYPSSVQPFACATPCYQLGSTSEADYCCTSANACGVTGVCLNDWSSVYADFRAVCNGCNISNCDQIIFEVGPSSGGGYNSYQIKFASIEITVPQ